MCRRAWLSDFRTNTFFWVTQSKEKHSGVTIHTMQTIGMLKKWIIRRKNVVSFLK